MYSNKPSVEDVLELSGIEVLHPGGFDLSKRIGQIVDMKDKKVLDVSCGRGIFACYYVKNFGAKVTGIDISSDMIQSSRNRAKKEGVEDSTEFKVANSLDLPFPENSFDIVVNECAVGLTSDPQKCLNEMMRVTKPGGTIIIHESLWLKELPEKEKNDLADRIGTVPFTLSEWRDMLKRAEATDIYDEDWSDIDKMLNMRPDRKIKNTDDIFSLWEIITIIIPKVIKKYGLHGLFYLNETRKIVKPYYYHGTYGYCLMKGNKQIGG